MKKLLVILLLLIGSVHAEGPLFSHKDSTTQQEFENAYQDLRTKASKSSILFINVKDYGAKGDGVTDDALAIQTVLNLANTNGSVFAYFPTGTYLIGSKLTMYSYSTLQGFGKGMTTIKAKAAMNDRMVVASGSPAYDVVIQDILFDLNGSNQTASNALTFSVTDGFQMRRCELRNAYDSLFLLTGSPSVTYNKNAVFEDIYFSGAGQQQAVDLVDIGNGTNIKMTRIRAVDAKAATGDAMLSIAIVDNFVITDSYLDGNNNGVPIIFAGISGGKMDGCEIKNSYESGTRIAYWLEIQPEKFMENFAITNNNIHDNAFEGIWVRAAGSSTQTIKNLKIDNNSIWNNQKYGIRCQTANGLTISNNSIYNNSLAGAGTYAALDFGGLITGAVNSTNIVRVYGNNIYDSGATQTFLYNLNYVSTFTSHNNFVSQITTRITQTNSTKILDLDAGNEGVRSFTGTFTRDTAAASGNVSYTGVGFPPSSVSFFAAVVSSNTYSWGFDDGTRHRSIANTGAGLGDTFSSESIAIEQTASNTQTGHILTLDTDGFTIAWTKAGSPTGTMRVFYMAQR